MKKRKSRIYPRCGAVLFLGARCGCRQAIRGERGKVDTVNAAAYVQRGGKLL